MVYYSMDAKSNFVGERSLKLIELNYPPSDSNFYIIYKTKEIGKGKKEKESLLSWQ